MFNTMTESSRILKLDETVVNRIAAGEVVQRPSAAIKEMLENSLDAGATSITVTVKGGGLQLLQIQDNGHGICKDDLGIACERFTTSKLQTFEDLKSISTFGFRGEALASITHVSYVTITTRTADSQCAYKAKYADGKLVPLRDGGKADPQPCAGTVGTTIAVEDLFYNMHTRKQAFKNLNEQYQRVLDVVTKYSVHFACHPGAASGTAGAAPPASRGVSFTCKRTGAALADLHTSAAANTVETIKLAYGANVARELMHLEFSEGMDGGGYTRNPDGTEAPTFQVQGKITNANYSSKRGMCILFINNRLVESASIKKVAETLYDEILPKHSHPFLYFSVTMPPQHVDVNVHPTKKEVHFLHETELLEALHREISKLLRGANASRTFYTQALLPAQFEQQPESAAQGDSAPDAAAQGTASSSFGAADDGIETEDEKEATLVGDTQHPGLQANQAPQKASRTTASAAGTAAPAPAKAAKAPYDPKRLVRVDALQTRIDSVFRAEAAPAPVEERAGVKRVRGSAETKDRQEEGEEEEEEEEEEDTDLQILMCGDCGLLPPQGAFAAFASSSSSSRGSGVAPACECCAPGERIGRAKQRKKKAAQTDNSSADAGAVTSHNFTFQETPVQYDSISNLLAQVRSRQHVSMQKTLSQYVLVGLVDTQWTAVQCGTRLLLLDHSRLAEILFYQLALRRFSVMPRVPLASPISIRECIRAALGLPEAQWVPADGDREDIAKRAAAILAEKGDMLREYFSLTFTAPTAPADADADADADAGATESRAADSDALLSTIPELLPGHRPEPQHLGMFLLRLATDTDWEDEQECFQGVAARLADFYARLSGTDIVPPDSSGGAAEEHKEDKISSAPAQLQRFVVDTLLPAVRAHLTLPMDCATDGTVIQVAALEQLYKVFERC